MRWGDYVLLRLIPRTEPNAGIKGLLSVIHWLDAVCTEGHLRQPDTSRVYLQGSFVEVLMIQEPWRAVSIYKDQEIQVLVPKLPESSTACLVPG